MKNSQTQTYPPPAFKLGDRVSRNSGEVGIVTEVRRWDRLGKIAYRVCGVGFPPRHYFAESVLSSGEGEVLTFWNSQKEMKPIPRANLSLRDYSPLVP